VPPPQALGPQQLIDAAAFDRDALLLVEVGLQAVECPATEGQAQSLRISQRRRDNGGALVGVIGVGAARAGAVLQGGQAAVVEPADPGRDGGPGDVQLACDVGRRLALGHSQEDLGAFDESGRGGACVGESLQFAPLIGGQLTEGDSGWHGCISIRMAPRPASKPLAG
jgi:hypothetical protein